MNENICREIYALVKNNLPDILALRFTGQLKDDGTYVSKGDLLCDRLVREYIMTHIPGSHIVSEEDKSSWSIPADKDVIITVDHIDGTENFVSGLKEWGMGVSIYRKGEHFQSMIALPELDICVVTGDKTDRVPSSRLCGLPSYMKQEHFEQLGHDYEYRQFGCCMINMYNVIKGSFAKFLHLTGCYSWDILPGMNLALENGLSVEINGVPYHGQFLQPGVKYKFVVGQPKHNVKNIET